MYGTGESERLNVWDWRKRKIKCMGLEKVKD